MKLSGVKVRGISVKIRLLYMPKNKAQFDLNTSLFIQHGIGNISKKREVL